MRSEEEVDGRFQQAKARLQSAQLDHLAYLGVTAEALTLAWVLGADLDDEEDEAPRAAEIACPHGEGGTAEVAEATQERAVLAVVLTCQGCAANVQRGAVVEVSLRLGIPRG